MPHDAKLAGPFDRFATQDIQALIAEYPLAWMLLPDCGDTLPIELPIIGDHDEDGRLRRLIGHFGRRNPIHEAVRRSPRARFLFRGPDGYVSPEHAGLRNWGPTWNYAHLVIDTVVTVDDAMTEEALAVLVEAMENGRVHPWNATELGARYDGLRQAIIGFHAEVTSINGRFKLGQDERPEVFASIVAKHPDEKLVRWMQMADGERG